MILRLKTVKKINFFQYKWCVYLFLFIFSTSEIMQAVPRLNDIVNVLRIISFLLLCYSYALNCSLSKLFIAVCLWLSIQLCSCILNQTLSRSFWFNFINFIGITLFTHGGISDNPKLFLKCGTNYYGFILFANIIHLLFFPGYKAESGTVYLLGLRIGFTLYVFVGILFSVVYDYWYGPKRLSRKTKCIFLLGFLNLLIEMVATGLIGLAVFIMTYYLVSKIKPSHPQKYFWIPLIAFVLVVLLQSSFISFFSPLFNLFGKNITLSGRTWIWPDAIELIIKNPIIGYGKTDFYVRAFGSEHPAHNEILNDMYFGGILSVAVFSYIISLLIQPKEYFDLRGIYLSMLFALCFVMLVEILSLQNGFYYIISLGYCIYLKGEHVENNNLVI